MPSGNANSTTKTQIQNDPTRPWERPASPARVRRVPVMKSPNRSASTGAPVPRTSIIRTTSTSTLKASEAMRSSWKTVPAQSTPPLVSWSATERSAARGR